MTVLRRENYEARWLNHRPEAIIEHSVQGNVSNVGNNNAN